jgi:hypothetical protein
VLQKNGNFKAGIKALVRGASAVLSTHELKARAAAALAVSSFVYAAQLSTLPVLSFVQLSLGVLCPDC